MAIAATLIASGTSTNASSFSVTTTQDSPVGSYIFVLVGLGAFSSASSSITVTDSAGNTYTALNGGTFAASDGAMKAFYCNSSANDLPNGGTITASYTTTGGAVGANIIAAVITGLASTPLDVNGTLASGNSTSPSKATGTLAQASEIIIGCVATYSTAFGTEDAAFTSLATVNGSNNRRLHVGYDIVSATTTVTYNPSITSGNWACDVYTFKGASAGTSVTFDNGSPTDFGGGIASDVITRAEWWTIAKADGTTLLDFGEGAIFDAGSRPEFGQGEPFDLKGPVEPGAGAFGGVAGPFSWLGNVLIDGASPIEFALTAPADDRAPVEFGGALFLDFDALSPLEWGASLVADSVSLS